MRMSEESSNRVIKLLSPLVESSGSQAHVRSLFDTHQTHAVYGICEDQVPFLKCCLKSMGAIRFRVVKIKRSDIRILCFNASRMLK